jgi:predicted ATPase/class 3 adenylate cyclase
LPVAVLPSGTVTFLFTDIEGSTRSWEDHPMAMRSAVERHDAIVRGAVGGHGGYVFSTAGDAFAAAFGRAGDAISAARAVQVALAAESWPEGVVVRVRMGIHTGEAQERGGDYFGPVLNRAARIMSAGHGGQVLVSASTAALLAGEVLVELGEHRLKDLSEPLRLFQLGDDTFPAIATLSADSGGLPVQRTELLGRAEDVAAVADLVGAHRLVTLVGFGGIGKTRLALAAAAEVADRFPRGIHFVDLAPIADGLLVGLAALEAAGISAARLGGDGSVHDRAAAALAGQDLLLVLDNCEHVVDDVVEFVDRLLELSDTPAVLATSREALEIDGERRYRVRPLEVGVDAAGPAVELFVQRAIAAGGRVEATDPAVREVCERLDGVPLAIELAAARTSLMSVEELAGRLGRQLDVLTSRRRRGRHRSLEAVLEWSWELLAGDVGDLLVQLAVFSGGWTLEAAGAICDDPDTVADRLETLVACSLVEVADGATATRFSMLEPVRQFATARLESDPRADRLRDRHLDWWVQHATVRRVGEQWFSGRWAAELGDEFDNLRQAVTHAVDTGRVEDAAALLGAIQAFSMDGLRGPELDLLADAVLRAWSDPPARFWLASAINFNGQGDYRRLAQRLEVALERAADEGDVACEAFAADWVSSSLANTDPERARALADTALTAARLAGDPDLLVLSLAWTGMTAYITGDTPTALERFDEADRVTIGQWSIAASQLHLTRAFVALDVPEAGDPEALLEMSYAGAPRRGFHSRLPVLYCAFPRARAGDVPAVAGAIDEAFELSVAHGQSVGYADISIAAAELLENLGRFDDAAAIIAALYRQTFTSHAQYHRYRRARSRLPSAPTPDRQLTVPELHDIVRTRLANLTGQPATTGTGTHADWPDPPRS